MKNLDEAIIHCEEVAVRERDLSKADGAISEGCLKCAKDHEQLAEWLKELKALREGKANSEQEAKQYAIGYQDGFLDAKKQFERPQGEWKLHGMIYYCSECGHDCEQGGNNFCGNCGARMKGGAECVKLD